MKRHLVSALSLLVGSACSQGAPRSASAITAPSPVNASVSAPVNYRAHLTGGAVVPLLPVSTRAQGEAILQLNANGTELSFHVNVANIDNVTAAHIHIAPVGLRGPNVVFLMDPVPAGGGRTDGVLATGTIRAADLIGPFAGQPLSALINEIAAGNAYVDVPTNDGVAPPNTGPGDYIGGELRGQLR